MISPLDHVVAIIPSRQSNIAVLDLRGNVEKVTRIPSHSPADIHIMARFLDEFENAAIVLQAPQWRLANLVTTDDLAKLHGTAETAIRWSALAELRDRDLRRVFRAEYMNDLVRDSLCRRNDVDRVLFHELARRLAPTVDREHSEVICFGYWALRQLPMSMLGTPEALAPDVPSVA